ncbi:hypothetical protein FQN60_004672, partial [Etheostoma spectabile]
MMAPSLLGLLCPFHFWGSRHEARSVLSLLCPFPEMNVMDMDDMAGLIQTKADSPCSHQRPFAAAGLLQKASGCWVLDPDLAAALGKTSEEVESQACIG